MIAAGDLLIAGGSGLLGKSLSGFLQQQGTRVKILTRDKKKADQSKYYYWDPYRKEIDEDAFRNVSMIVNLCGANVAAHRWTLSYKEEIQRSRIEPADFLYETCRKNDISLTKYISAAAVGIYPSTDEPMNENSEKGKTFLSNVCKQWEAHAKQFENISTNVCILRIGVVLSAYGGFIKEVGKLIKMYTGAYLGNGDQMMSWIHEQDLDRMVVHMLSHESYGAYNAVTSQPTTNREVTKMLADALKRKIVLPHAPAFMLKFLFGEMSYELLVSHNITPVRIVKEDFRFNFPGIKEAVYDCVQRSDM